MHKCEVCKGSGETGSYGVLDCAAPGCTAATERHELKQLAGDASLTDYDARWLAYQAGKAAPLAEDDVQWVTNDSAELGVKIGDQFFFLYKGSSLVYEDAQHDNGEPMMWRPVFKREFGECVRPINYDDFSKIGKVSLDDSEDWKPLKAKP